MRRIHALLTLTVTLLVTVVLIDRRVRPGVARQCAQFAASCARPWHSCSIYEPGPLNAITDVAGVRVGQTTIVQGEDVRTGVTAIFRIRQYVQEKVAGGLRVQRVWQTRRLETGATSWQDWKRPSCFAMR